MTSTQPGGSQDLSWNSFKLSVKTLVTMIAGGGLITWIFLTDGIRDAAYQLSREIEPLYLEQIGGLNPQEIGILWSIFSIAMLVTPLASGKMSDKYGERVNLVCYRVDELWSGRGAAFASLFFADSQGGAAEQAGDFQ